MPDRHTLPGYADPTSEAPMGSMHHVTCSGIEFPVLTYKNGEVIAAATHRGKCGEKQLGYHTHYLIGLEQSSESRWNVGRYLKRRIRRAHCDLPNWRINYADGVFKAHNCDECRRISRGYPDRYQCNTCGFAITNKAIECDEHFSNVLQYLEKREQEGKTEIAADINAGSITERVELEALQR